MSDLVDFKRKLKKVLSENNVGTYLIALEFKGETQVIGEGETKDLAHLAFQANAKVVEKINSDI